MSIQTRRYVRRALIFTLTAGFFCSMMYVSFAFGFRSGIMEDTVYILQQC